MNDGFVHDGKAHQIHVTPNGRVEGWEHDKETEELEHFDNTSFLFLILWLSTKLPYHMLY